ncbi:MAG: zinc ribbon domain-containing protein [Phycisphaerales bacterium]|nr:zinc ribbon domain-containing protein [Phycisphaerales bacterium]
MLIFAVLMGVGVLLVAIGLMLGVERRRRRQRVRLCPAPQCGHANVAAARYCARCGQALDGSS